MPTNKSDQDDQPNIIGQLTKKIQHFCLDLADSPYPTPENPIALKKERAIKLHAHTERILTFWANPIWIYPELLGSKPAHEDGVAQKPPYPLYDKYAANICQWLVQSRLRREVDVSFFPRFSTLLTQHGRTFDDVLCLLGLFLRLIEHHKIELKSIGKKQFELKLFELACISFLLASKVNESDWATIENMLCWIEKLRPHYYQELLGSLSLYEIDKLQREAKPSTRYWRPPDNTLVSEKAFCKARMINLEFQAVEALNFRLIPIASEYDQANLLVRLASCQRQSCFFDKNNPDYLKKDKYDRQIRTHLKNLYKTEGKEARSTLRHLFDTVLPVCVPKHQHWDGKRKPNPF